MKSPRVSSQPHRSGVARLLLAVSTCLWALPPGRSEPDGFSSQRVLEISTPSVREDIYARQAALALPHWDGLIERELVIVTREGADTFKVRLIGKDGGEKLASSKPVTMSELFAVIDQMPMRRQEMKRTQAATGRDRSQPTE